ncbi:MAG: D-tyrosyl-tRNA(Tyr) deacylase [Verrucomicrobia bacterium]|nr:D-tyrosyl-tRNA(Tyr) deacylase [Verrucomicrobiota bacterium]
MRVILQRVSEAGVEVDSETVGQIGEGLLILLGIESTDDECDVEWLARKICQLRLFEDDAEKMNRSLLDVGGSALVVSQFTLHAQVKKGTRPSFIKAARPEQAVPLYEAFVAAMENELGEERVATGVFGAMMKVSLVNDGPVTISIDSRNRE